MGRPKKKYILFLVEGYTDIEVLAEPFTSIYEMVSPPDSPVEVEFCAFNQNGEMGGDITSSNGVSPDNIEGLIGKLFIDPFLDKNPFIYPKEISEIIHIVDLDGAFIPNECVKEKNTEDGPIYTENEIYTSNAENIHSRNKRKSDNIRKLLKMDEIVIRPKNGRNTKTVKYSIYYFSCNMDHYIHKRLNLSSSEKTRLADDFNAACSLDKFVKTICFDDDACKDMTYQGSWEYAMRGIESLNRHTNLNILIEKLFGGEVPFDL